MTPPKILAILPDEEMWVLASSIARSTYSIERLTFVPTTAPTTRSVSVAIVDMSAFDQHTLDFTQSWFAFVRSNHIITWFVPTPQRIRRVLDLSIDSPQALMLRGKEGEGRRLQRLLSISQPPTATALLLHAVAPRIRRLPNPLRSSVTALFGAADVPTRLSDWDPDVVSRYRTFERQAKQAGCGTLGAIIDLVRLSGTWEDVTATNQTLTDIAATHGYSFRRVLSGAFRRYADLALARERHTMDTTTFVARLAAQFR